MPQVLFLKETEDCLENCKALFLSKSNKKRKWSHEIYFALLRFLLILLSLFNDMKKN